MVKKSLEWIDFKLIKSNPLVYFKSYTTQNIKIVLSTLISLTLNGKLI